jgi:hypothetical protein
MLYNYVINTLLNYFIKEQFFPKCPGNRLQLESHIDVRDDRNRKSRGRKITGLQVDTCQPLSPVPLSPVPLSHFSIDCSVNFLSCILMIVFCLCLTLFEEVMSFG